MNIKILDSWLRDHLQTNATPQNIAKAMSLTSVSIERMEKYGKDYVYDIEITTNRPDLMSIVGLAREAAAVLPQFGYKAEFIPPKITKPQKIEKELPLKIINNEKLVGRICAVVMEVNVKPSPDQIKERLETSDIRSLNNVIDVTNYIMRTIGHPSHVFDYDRLSNNTIRIRESSKGEQITTLDGKTYTLAGGDIVADDGEGNIIDLIGIMGLQNSVVTNDTKRIVLFIDNNDPQRMRRTSMQLNIRTEAVQMNEKSIDPELAYDALTYGISLYQDIAEATLLSNVIDIYPSPKKTHTVSVSLSKIHEVIGVPIQQKEAETILHKLGFKVESKENIIKATIPSYRSDDITIPEDLIEEIARVYGYHNLPSLLPPITTSELTQIENNQFYWEDKVKGALKYWGYTEVYSYPMVSEQMYEGPLDNAVKLANPLGEEFVYMRRTLVPNLLKVVNDNKNYESIKIFEIANVYEKQGKDLPSETRNIAILIQEKGTTFFHLKGLLEQLTRDIGIQTISFEPADKSGLETNVLLNGEEIGSIEVLDENLINTELNFEALVAHASNKKSYLPLSKFPSIYEDLSLIVPDEITTKNVIDTIKSTNTLIKSVTFIDKYENSKTFHIEYQDENKNLTNEEVKYIRNDIFTNLKNKLSVLEKK